MSEKLKNNITEMVFILDKSGSMSGMEADTIGGFNAMIEKQKKIEGKAYVSTVLFSNYSKVLYDRVDIEKIELPAENELCTEDKWILSKSNKLVKEVISSPFNFPLTLK